MKKYIKILLPALVIVGCLCIVSTVVAVSANIGGRVPILMYHHLVPDNVYEEMKYAENGSVVKNSDFEAQMKWLHDNGYNTIFVSDLVHLLKSDNDLPENTVVITFDDGYESNYVYAYPVLKKYNLKANIAPVVKCSEFTKDKPQPEFDDYKLPHMNFVQMKEMQDSGVFEIGSHSYDGHGDVNVDLEGNTAPFFVNYKVNTKTEHKETREEYLLRINKDIVTSKIILDEKLGQSERFFVYPYGKYNKDVCKVVETAGFDCALTTKPAYVKKNSDLYMLPRFPINNEVKSLDDFIDIVDVN